MKVARGKVRFEDIQEWVPLIPMKSFLELFNDWELLVLDSMLLLGGWKPATVYQFLTAHWDHELAHLVNFPPRLAPYLVRRTGKRIHRKLKKHMEWQDKKYPNQRDTMQRRTEYRMSREVSVVFFDDCPDRCWVTSPGGEVLIGYARQRYRDRAVAMLEADAPSYVSHQVWDAWRKWSGK